MTPQPAELPAEIRAMLLAMGGPPEQRAREAVLASGYDVEAFIDGYVACALWADCMPADRCVHCGGLLEYRELGAFWRHAEGSPRATFDHPAERDENAEMGGGEGLELREGVRERMAVDCRAFIAGNLPDLRAYNDAVGPWTGTDSRGYVEDEPSEASAGHDFWLTRSGHGTGFWDRGLGELGGRLTAAAKVYGEPDNHTPYDCGDGTADV